MAAAKPHIPLQFIPDHLKLRILYKMETSDLCRMRRTCSYANGYIEENKKKLSRKPGEKSVFTMQIINNDSQDLLCVHRPMPTFGDENTKYFNLSLDSVDKHFSAVPIGHMSIIIIDNFEFGLIMECLKKIKLSCDSARLWCESSSEDLVALSDSIDCRGEIIHDNGITVAREDFEKLNMANNRSKFKIYVIEPSDIIEEFEIVRNFSTVVCCQFTGELICRLIRRIYNSGDCGSLKKLKCQSLLGKTENPPFSDPSIPMPPMELLWDISISTTTDNRILPEYIRRMEVGSKSALIVKRQDQDTILVEIYFLNRPEVFDKVMKELRIEDYDEGLQKEFLTATEERRTQIVKDGFLLNE